MKKSSQILIYNPEDSTVVRIFRSAACLFIALAVAAIWYYGLSAPKKNISQSLNSRTLQEEFQRISAPKNVISISDIVATSKVGFTTIEQRYRTDSARMVSILNRYDSKLKENGWTYLRRYSGGAFGVEVYCKGAYDANIEFSLGRDQGELNYLFSMSKGHVATYECAPKLK